MIKTFKHKGLKQFFCDNDSRLLNQQQVGRIRRIPDRLDTIRQIEDMALPGYALHPLTGNKKGFWSVKVSGNWRLTFRFQDGDAYEVNLEDYH